MIELTKEFDAKREKLEAQLKKAEQTRDNAVKKIEALKKQIAEIDSNCKKEIFDSFISSAQEIGLASDSPEDLQAFINGLLKSSPKKNKSAVKDSLTTDFKSASEPKAEDDGLKNILADDDDEEVSDVLSRIGKE